MIVFVCACMCACVREFLQPVSFAVKMFHISVATSQDASSLGGGDCFFCLSVCVRACVCACARTCMCVIIRLEEIVLSVYVCV